jgi:hypothetical protein
MIILMTQCILSYDILESLRRCSKRCSHVSQMADLILGTNELRTSFLSEVPAEPSTMDCSATGSDGVRLASTKSRV